MGFVEPAVPRPFKEVKTNIFETVPLGWKLENSQKGWSQEKMRGTMEWEENVRKEEMADSQIEERGEMIQTINRKEELEE